MPVTTNKNPYHLNDIQVAIVKLMVEGLNNREIAHRLVYSEHTVKAASMFIYRLMDVQNRVQAAVKWVREQERET